MPLPLVLAQAVPVLTQETSISLPVVVTIVTVAAAIIESRVKLARLEKDLELLESQVQGTAIQVASQATLLGEIRAGILQLREELRAARGAQ